MNQPSGYRSPLDPTRDRDQVMRDRVAQNLIAQLVDLHEALCIELDQDVARAAQGAAEPASGYVTGSNDHDQMVAIAAAVKQAEAERARQRKNAHEMLRRAIRYYTHGERPPPRPRVETIDYLNGDGQRRVG